MTDMISKKISEANYKKYGIPEVTHRGQHITDNSETKLGLEPCMGYCDIIEHLLKNIYHG